MILRTDIERCTIAVVRRGEGTRPEIRKVSCEGEVWVLKDYLPLNRLQRKIGEWLVQRETKALQALSSVSGIIQLKGVVDRYALATGFVEGKALNFIKPGEVKSVFFQRVREIVREVHEQGFVLGDIKSSNILVSGEDQPFLLDLASAVRLPAPLFEYVKRLDDRKLAKLLFQHAPQLLSLSERESISYRYPLEGAIRAAAKRGRSWLKKS